MRYALAIGLLAACGRFGFGSRDDGGAAEGVPPIGDAVLHDLGGFDAPSACLAATVPACGTGTATALSLGLDHACAARSGSRMDCWGNNNDGQLAFCMTTSAVDAPTPSFGFAIAQLAMGETHSCARLVDGTVWCWGSRFEGESGTTMSNTPDPVPRQVGATWQDLSARRFHTCAIASTGALFCWGRDLEGELGNGMLTDTPIPQQVGTATDWQIVRAAGISTCGLRAGGVAYCWGDNTHGQVGDGTTTTPRTTPVPVMFNGVFTQLAGGKQHLCGLDSGGAVWCWGYGFDGQLGNGMIGATADSSVPVKVPGGPYVLVAAGWFDTCAIDQAGQLWCWGDNSLMNMFPTAQTSYATPTLVDAGPWAEVESGEYFRCARTAAGAVKCWGQNNVGQLGVRDTTTPHSTPTAVCFGN